MSGIAAGIAGQFGFGGITPIGSKLRKGAAIRFKDGITIAVRVSETHNLESQVTEQAIESGARVSDHVILKPRTVTVIYEQTNSFWGMDKARKAWDKFYKFWSQRTPVMVICEHQIYSDMIFEHVTALHQAPFKGAFQFTATLKKISYATLRYVKVPAGQLGSDVNKTASSEVNAGQVSASDVLGPTEMQSEMQGTTMGRGY